MAKATAEGKSPATLDLPDFVTAINPKYERPDHLAPLVDVFRRAALGEVRALVSVPPQHCKTETVLMALAHSLAINPSLHHAYVSYAQELASAKSRTCKDYALAAGVQLRDDAQSVKNWITTAGGGLRAIGRNGQLTGAPVDGILVIDDPHKNREEAESALHRQRCHDFYTSTAQTRLHPGASVIVVHTRWHPDDLIGRLSHETVEAGSDKQVFEVINLPAIGADGTALWHRRPLDFLHAKRRAVGEYDWASLYMGSPRPRGTAVFRGAKFYDQLPPRYRIGKGVDLAYTAKTRADWSCSVVLTRGEDENGEPLYFVTDVRRAQVEVPTFVTELEAVDASWPGGWHWFCSTTEKGVAQLLTYGGVHVEPVLATADKFVRAQPVSIAWNEGRVLVPRHAPWLKTFVDEVGNFTGVGDRHDDMVDALASAFEQVRHTAEPPRTSQKGQFRYHDLGGYGRG